MNNNMIVSESSRVVVLALGGGFLGAGCSLVILALSGFA